MCSREHAPEILDGVPTVLAQLKINQTVRPTYRHVIYVPFLVLIPLKYFRIMIQVTNTMAILENISSQLTSRHSVLPLCVSSTDRRQGLVGEPNFPRQSRAQSYGKSQYNCLGDVTRRINRLILAPTMESSVTRARLGVCSRTLLYNPTWCIANKMRTTYLNGQFAKKTQLHTANLVG